FATDTGNGSQPAERWRQLGPLLYRVDTIGIEGEVLLDLVDGRVRFLVRPNGIHGTLSANGNTVVRAITLEGAVRGVVRALQERHVDIFARDVLNYRIGRLAQRQRFAGIGDDAAGDRHDHS